MGQVFAANGCRPGGDGLLRESAELCFSLFGVDLKGKVGLVGQDGVEVYGEAGPGREDIQLGLSKEGWLLVL